MAPLHHLVASLGKTLSLGGGADLFFWGSKYIFFDKIVERDRINLCVCDGGVTTLHCDYMVARKPSIAAAPKLRGLCLVEFLSEFQVGR